MKKIIVIVGFLFSLGIVKSQTFWNAVTDSVGMVYYHDNALMGDSVILISGLLGYPGNIIVVN